MARKKSTADDTAAATTPKKKGRLRQMVEVFRFTQKTDPSTLPMMLVALLVPIVLAVALAWLILDAKFYGLFLGLAIGILAAMFVLARRAERAAYARIAGQPGAALAAMQSIRRGWNVEQEPCQFDPRTQDMLFRASGRAGVALVAESSSGRVLKLIDKEKMRLRKSLPNVPVHTIIVGDGDGEVKLQKVASHMMRLKAVLTKDEAGAVGKRLAAFPSPVRQAIPKGVDPMKARPNRKAMRGR